LKGGKSLIYRIIEEELVEEGEEEGGGGGSSGCGKLIGIQRAWSSGGACGHEWQNAKVQKIGHYGVFLGCSSLNQTKCQQRVGNTEDHQEQNGDQQPGMILVNKDEVFFVLVTTRGLAPATEQEKFQPRSGV
jgi:hypothetical protein